MGDSDVAGPQPVLQLEREVGCRASHLDAAVNISLPPMTAPRYRLSSLFGRDEGAEQAKLSTPTGSSLGLGAFYPLQCNRTESNCNLQISEKINTLNTNNNVLYYGCALLRSNLSGYHHISSNRLHWRSALKTPSSSMSFSGDHALKNSSTSPSVARAPKHVGPVYFRTKYATRL